jgi:hypothetical protein
MLKNLIPLLGLLLPFLSIAQNAPQTALPELASATPGTVEIPVTVTNFTYIGAIYLSIDYDYSVMQLTGATPHPQLPSFLHGDSDLGTGFHRITLGWYGNGLTLPDGSAIMTLSFNYTGGNSLLTFFDNGPSCEYANGDGNVLNDMPTGDYYFNGQVCGFPENPGPIAGPNTVCQAQQMVCYSVQPSPNAVSYNWAVPFHSSIVCGQGTNLILLSFQEDAASESIFVRAANACGVQSEWSELEVQVNDEPLASVQYIPAVPYGTSATLHASSGGNSTYSYHWSPEEMLVDPDVQDPQTVPLYQTTVFDLLVTDLVTGCQASQAKYAVVSGGPLQIHPTAWPDTSCYGYYVMLYPMESGGTGTYTYLWESDPPGWTSTLQYPQPQIFTSTTFILTVDDGNTAVTDSVSLPVEPEITATISGTDTLCGDGESAILNIELTGTPPWNLVYTFGSQSVFLPDQAEPVYSLVTGTAGDYSISYVSNNYCNGIGQGQGSVSWFPVPPAPVISLIETTLVSNACCGNQWYHNNEAIPGATGISYTATESGKYYDIVTRFSCVSDTSNLIDVIIDGIAERDQSAFVIFPNPAREQIHVRLSMDDGRFDSDVTLEIYDIFGRELQTTVISSPLKGGGREGAMTVDISSLPPGLYLAVVKVDQAILGTCRFVKTRY